MTCNIKGQTFGFLTAIRPTNERKNGSVIWKCKCICGRVVYVKLRDLKCGQKRSCGCLRKYPKKVLCKETGRVYSSAKEAGADKFTTCQNIYHAIKHPHYSAAGYHWEYV